MRRYLFSTIFFAALPAMPVLAQNYLPLNDYSGAGVVVNMDVLSGSRPASPYGVTPTLSQPLPPVAQQPRAMTPPIVLRRPAPNNPASVTAPVPVAAPPIAAAPKYISPVAPVPAAEEEAVYVPPPAPTPVAPAAVSTPIASPAKQQVSQLAPAPAPFPDGLIMDEKPSSNKTAYANPVQTKLADHQSVAPKANGGRQELASFHDPISDDVIDVSDQSKSSSYDDVSSVSDMPPAKPVEELLPPVDEMAPIEPRVAKEKPTEILKPVTPQIAAMPTPAPAIPSPTADRPGKKSGQIQTAMLSPNALAPMANPTGNTPGMAPELNAVNAPSMTAEMMKPAGDDFEAYRLLFGANSQDLEPSETAILDKVTTKLNADPALHLQVRAYANGTPETASAARRLSLSRALKVREYLMKKNIVATRLDIRALGSGSVEMGDEVGRSTAPADRVDVIFAR